MGVKVDIGLGWGGIMGGKGLRGIVCGSEYEFSEKDGWNKRWEGIK